MTWLFAAFISFATGAEGEVWINEILFNPPSTNDAPNEYIELRGTPNLILPAGTCFVAVEGDANGNPGTVQTIFDLSGRAIGGNGFLVLLQNSNSFLLNTNCFALINTNGGGLNYMHSGMYGMYAIQESIRQLRGRAAAQVEGVRTSLCQGIGGMFAAAGTIIFANHA